MKKNKGFSLLEILIAMAILIIGVAAVVNLFPVGLNASKRAANFTMAGILAQEKIAEAMYLGYDRLDEIYNINTGDDAPFPSPDEEYWCQMYYDNLTGTMDNVRKITLRIYWLDRGVERGETFITYIADYSA